MLWNNNIKPTPVTIDPGMASAADSFQPANIITNNSAPKPIRMRGQKKSQFKAWNNWPVRDSKPKTIMIAPPMRAPMLERFVCISFSFEVSS